MGASIVAFVIASGLIAVGGVHEWGAGRGVSSYRIPVSPRQLGRLGGVPVRTLVAAAPTGTSDVVVPPTSLPPGVPALVSGGKPEVVYLGAENCAPCAAERWPLVMALSKFGTFHNLTRDTALGRNIPTFSFYKATYTSPYLTLAAVELRDRTGAPLQTATAAQMTLMARYDGFPGGSHPNSSPFIDLGGRYVVSGAEYDGSMLSDVSFAKAISLTTGIDNATSLAIAGVTGELVGSICSLTDDLPGSVCSAVPLSLRGEGSRSSS